MCDWMTAMPGETLQCAGRHDGRKRPDGRDASAAAGRRAVRGGSWLDRPKRCTSSFRLSYEPYQRVFNVGSRIVSEANPGLP